MDPLWRISVVVGAAMVLACSSAGTGDPSLAVGDGAGLEGGAADAAGDGMIEPDTGPLPDGKIPPDAGADAGTEEDIPELEMRVPPDAAEVGPDTPAGCQSDFDCEEGLHCFLDDGSCVPCTEFTHCDDGNECTFEYCSADHVCMQNVVDGQCDDQDSCTTGDHCDQGACVPEVIVECDDGNPCTTDECPFGECQHNYNADPCEDGNPCTVGDKCHDAACESGTGKLTCEDDNECTYDSCVDWQGCANTPVVGPCDDDSYCTSGDHCDNGACVPDVVIPCDDGNACTDDDCSPDGGCWHDATPGAACEDGNPCTTQDTCTDAGICAGGPPPSCADGNVCTTDACVPGVGCSNPPAAGACDDGNACTTGDGCVNGACAGSGAKDCSDGNTCTADSCIAPGGQCMNEAAEGTCEDGDACTVGDACKDGQCASGAAAVCSDGNTCTEDSCNSASGCVYQPLTGSGCTDGSLCTENDMCTNGVCTGKAKTCVTPNQCASAACDPGTGQCAYSPLTGTKCDDGEVCTLNDACQNGTCVGGAAGCDDGDPCTNDACTPGVGCGHTPNTGAGCNDGNACTSGDWCQNGACAGTPVWCNDGNVCTGDECNPASGCYYPAKEGVCDDGNACTTGDHCFQGSCIGGDAIWCDDGNACTNDYCSGGACVYDPIPNCGQDTCLNRCGDYDENKKCQCDNQCSLPFYKDCCPDLCTYCPQHASCNCVPDCNGKECGGDGCGGSCGSCPQGEWCGWDHECHD